MTFFNTGAGKDGYFLHFETDDKEQYLYMQEAARLCLDVKIKGNTSGVYPERHAHFIKVPSATNKDTRFYECSACKSSFSIEDNAAMFFAIEWNGGKNLYCPYCGAKMDGKEEDQ